MQFLGFDSPYFSTLLSVATLQTLAVISPGPDFAIVTRNSILHSRRVGMSTALGVTFGATFHISYLVMGFGLLVSSLAKFLFLVKIAGCLYLGYLGIKGLCSSQLMSLDTEPPVLTSPLSTQSAFWNGFLTNLLNPKAILFLVSLFTVVLEKDTPPSMLLLCGAIIILITMAWFLLVSFSFSGVLKNAFLRLGLWIDRLTGGFLLFAGAKVGLSCFD